MLKKRWFKGLLIAVSVIALGVCAWCIIYIVQFFRGDRLDGELAAMVVSTAEPAVSATAGPVETPDPGNTEPDGSYTGMRVDFEALRAVNPEIYAWIYVPGTVISYPVVQSATDDLFYIDHSSDGEYFTGGSIFSQKTYNGLGFDAPMTVLYGHNLRSGKMFRSLNEFADEAFYESHREIYIITENAAYRYFIFAACPHTAEHLLANYDFSHEETFEWYFNDIRFNTNREYSHFSEDWFPIVGDRVLTLSTCFAKNNKYRYLVHGVLTDVWQLDDKEAAAQ